MTGCAGNNIDDKFDLSDIPYYTKTSIQFELPENANIYKSVYGQDGIFFYITENVSAEDSNSQQSRYVFFYQTYNEEELDELCSISEGIVCDFTTVKIDNENRLVVFQYGEHPFILEFNEKGEECKRISLNDDFIDGTELIHILALSEDRFVVSKGKKIYVIDSEGHITCNTELEGNISKLFVSDSKVYALIENSKAGYNARNIIEIDISNAKILNDKLVSNEIIEIFSLDSSFACVYRDRVVTFHVDQNDEKDIIDLDRQSLMASEIKSIFLDDKAIKIVSMSNERVGNYISLQLLEDENVSKESSNDDIQLTEDGRRIVYVAVPKNYPYQIEYHAKKYNQISDCTYIKVERIKDSLELFLGKGNRPDIIMFADQTETVPYIQKNALVDLTALFDNNKKYSLDGIIPKVREVLGNSDNNSIYSIAPNFRLLLRTSDGTEYDKNGNCNAYSYLDWYDNYLARNEIIGKGNLDFYLYANIGLFFNEDKVEAYFTTDDFKQFMKAYKKIVDSRRGEFDQRSISMEMGYKVLQISSGPRWYPSYSCPQLAENNTKIEGIPGIDGQNKVYMILDFPMSIMNTSKCKEEAFDFVMYYNSLEEFLGLGDSENSYGKSGTTTARFSVYESVLDKLIFETEKPYTTLDGVEFFYTSEQKEQLRALIINAVSDSRAQRVIYSMMMEEMNSYLDGTKELDDVCDILQNRGMLFLQENN